MKKTIIFFLVFFPFAKAIADDCNDTRNNAELSQCVIDNFKKADKILNSTYQKVMNITYADNYNDQKKLLRVAQNKWISYRDADCEFQSANSAGGSMYTADIYSCLEIKTKQRTKELNSMLR